MSILAKIGSKDSFYIPEKWCIRTRPETRDIILKFLNSKGYKTLKFSKDHYCHYPLLSVVGSAWMHPINGYTEITFDEFLKITCQY